MHMHGYDFYAIVCTTVLLTVVCLTLKVKCQVSQAKELSFGGNKDM